MYACPNCAAALSFSIKSQDLFCDHCDSHFSPYEIEKEQDAEFHETGMFENTIFTCPSCGGVIYSNDNTAASFCSYCGSPTILTQRIRQSQAPASIIPFQITKDDCIRSYKKALRGGIFAPSGMLSESHLDQFRGIYMPYWDFSMTQNNTIRVISEDSSYVGDYVKHKTYGTDFRILAEFRGYTYDAASNFHDSISFGIAPFDIHQMKRFTPSYLLGFYANVADVPSSFYSDQAEAEAKEELRDFLYENERLKEVPGVLDYSSVDPQLIPVVTQADPVMFPVWYLSYRYKNRVAYATVNGQTGKIYADLPVSIGKYILFAALISLVLFPFLFLLFPFRLIDLLHTALLTSLVTMFLYYLELKAIRTSLKFQDDVGYLYRFGDQIKGFSEGDVDQAIENQIRNNSQKKLKHAAREKRSKIGLFLHENREVSAVLGSMIIFLSYLLLRLDLLAFFLPTDLLGLPKAIFHSGSLLFQWIDDAFDLRSIGFYAALIAGTAIILPLLIRQWRIQKEVAEELRHIPGILFCGISYFTALLTMFLAPANHLLIYAAAAVSILMQTLSLIQLFHFYNHLATRKLPQYTMYEDETENSGRMGED